MSGTIAELVELFLQSPLYRSVKVVFSREEAYFAQREFCFEVELPPREMIIGPADEHGNALWHPVDSPVTREMAEGFDRFLQIELPWLFKEYISYKCIIQCDFYEAILPEIDPRRPLSWLEWCFGLSKRRLYQKNPWLIPLTYGPDFQSTLCIDARRKRMPCDYPIVIIHDAKMEQLAEAAMDVASIRELEVFDSFESYIRFVKYWMIYRIEAPEIKFRDWMAAHGYTMPPDVYYELH